MPSSGALVSALLVFSLLVWSPAHARVDDPPPGAVGPPVGGALPRPRPSLVSRAGGAAAAAICRMIEAAAPGQGLPVRTFTRLIWRESSFRPKVVSRAGARGIAQFMPGTADERGLADPFDPEEAIPASASLIADLKRRFGYIGLAAAAYNAGPRRVERWLAGDTSLPFETQAYVLFVTGTDAESWKSAADDGKRLGSDQDCLTVVAEIRATAPGDLGSPYEGTFAPWGVQLVGNYSKDRALANFEKIRQRYGSVIGEAQPLILGTRVGGRGPRRFYRIRVPFQTRAEANALCRTLRQKGGACIVQRN